MIKEIKYPKNFSPIHSLEICTNKIIGGGSIIGFDNFSPVLIGKGKVPLVWLYVKADKSNWIPLVSESISNHGKIMIEKNEIERLVAIKIDETILMKARMLDDNSCLVDKLDLRPVGLNLFGDENGLSLGNSKFNGNTFQGVTFMIGLSDPIST